MRIIAKNLKIGFVELQATTTDDAWVLKSIIVPGDRVKGRTERKIQVSEEKTIRKMVFLSICVEKSEYEPEHGLLRVTGKIVDGPEDIARGQYHSFAIENGTHITLEKDRWQQFQLDKLEHACLPKQSHLIVLFDREQYIIGSYSMQGFAKITQHTASVAKKVATAQTENLYKHLALSLQEYNARYQPQSIIYSSPQFFKDYLLNEVREIDPTLAKKFIYIQSFSVTESALTEILSSKEFAAIATQDIFAKHTALFNDVLARIAKNGLVTYGISQCFDAANQAAIDTLLVTQKAMENHPQVMQILDIAQKTKSLIFIIDHESPIYKQLESLSGAVALLRFAVDI